MFYLEMPPTTFILTPRVIYDLAKSAYAAAHLDSKRQWLGGLSSFSQTSPSTTASETAKSLFCLWPVLEQIVIIFLALSTPRALRDAV
jgi:hypothetical protein